MKKNKTAQMLTHIPFKKCCNDLVFEAARKMGVSHWKIGLTYVNQDKKDTEHESYDDFVAASICVDRRYTTATVKVRPPVWRMWLTKDFAGMKTTLFHETAHICTQHMIDLIDLPYKTEDEIKDAWESLTELISRIAHQDFCYNVEDKKIAFNKLKK